MQVCGSPSTNWDVSYANNFGNGWHQKLRNLNSGLCLDLLNNNSTNGTPIQQWFCETADPEGNQAQLWML